MHGPTSTCPHLRVLPNLVSVCTAAVCSLLEAHKNQEHLNTLNHSNEDTVQHLNCYLSVISKICEFDDWRPGLAQLLQPIPFPDIALADEEFIRKILPVLEIIGTDPRCDVHQMVLGIREDKEGWLNVICPSSLACVDEGSTWAAIILISEAGLFRRSNMWLPIFTMSEWIVDIHPRVNRSWWTCMLLFTYLRPVLICK
ncbi:hypothetical protein SK128_001618 [Halocaridina rubra]|uniref:Uncharacterized protein n=1 Tax=Halocaridina rubra TaxID=373956 RepID=A0AAN9ADF3_HALRR